MKILFTIALGLALLTLVTSFDVGAMDGPHFDPAKIVAPNCGSCHNSSLPSDSITFNSNCLSCHADFYTGTNSAEKLTSHSWTGNITNPGAGAQPPTTGALSQVQDYTGSKLACVSCHNPHTNGNGKYKRIANATDQLCLDCHRSRNVKSHRVEPGQYPASHPVNVTYTAAVAANADGYNNPPLNANPANPKSDLGARLTASSNVIICSTCHSVHNAYSQSATPPVVDSNGKLGDGNLLRTNPRGAKVASGATDTLNLCTNCHKGKTNHNAAGQDIQCLDCHAAHVEYDPNDPTNTKGTNINLIRRNLPGTSNQILFRYAGDNREYKNEAGTGVCQGCHAVPSSIAQHASNDPNVCNSCHTHNNATSSFSASCNGCHGYPPSATSQPSVPAHPNDSNCSSCHNTDPSVHNNGYVNVSCDGCHGSPPPNAATGYTAVDETTSAHIKHAGAGTNYSYACSQCHKGNTHANGSFQDVFIDKSGIIAGSTATYATATRTCSTLYCHSNGTSVASGQTAAGSVVWGSNKLSCDDCHGYPPAYVNSSPKANNHGTGHNFSCGTCHAATTRDGFAISDNAKHVNKAYEVTPGAGTTFTYTYAANGGTCSNVNCHQGVNAKWGSNVNHIVNFGSRTAGFDLSYSHDYALSDSAPCATCHYANIVVQHNNDCSICHAGANPAASLIGSWNKTCESCHSSPHPPSVNHDFELNRCDTCHSDGGGSFYGCMECHSQSQTLNSYISSNPSAAKDAPPAVITGNLKLLYQFDEQGWYGFTDEVKDSSGWNNHGNAYNGASIVTGGVTGRAGSFNGTSSSVAIKYSPGTTPVDTFTLEAWVKPNAPHKIDTEKNTLYVTDGTSGQKYLFWPDEAAGDVTLDASAGISVGTNGVSVYELGYYYMPALAVYSGTISSSQWTHIAVVYNNKRPSIYVNGELVRVGLQSQRQHVYAPRTIGGNGFSWGAGWYSGLTDEIAVYDAVLSPDEILQHAQQACTATSNSAVSVRWTSAIASTSYVDYGLTTDYGSTLGNGTLVTTHTQALAGLADNTTYHYRVRSTTAAGVETVSGDNVFTAGSCASITTPPAAPTGVLSVAGVGQATVSWTRGTGASSSLIRYGTSPGSLISSIDPATSPQTIIGLVAGTTYYYQVGARNSAGTVWDSTIYTVTPTAPSLPTVTSPTATSISRTTAILGANVTSDGGVLLTVKGTCWGTAVSPTTNCVAQGTTTTGIFTHNRTGLAEGSQIYYRGYATNSAGTSYSPDATIYTEPTQPNSLSYTGVGSNGITVNWINGSTGNAKNVIVLMKAGTVVTANPVDGTTYTANAAFGTGTQIGATGYFVVYKGTGNSVAVTGLTASTTYQVKVYAFAAGANGTENYNLTSPLTGSQATSGALAVPTLTTPTATGIGSTTATLGANVTSVGGAALTARGTVWGTSPSPTVNPVAAAGTTTGVFTHARSSITAGTKIYYRGYATNSGGTGYSPDGSFYTEPSTQAASVNITSVSSTGMTVNWTRGDGDGVIVLMRQGSAVATDPTDGVYAAYSPNAAFGSGAAIGSAYVVYKGTGSNVAITGLTAGNTYYVAVYEYKGAGDTSGVNQGTNYKSAAATGSQATVVAPPAPPTIQPPVAGNGQAAISWTAGTGSTSSVLRYGTTSGVYSNTIDPASSPYTITGLINGTAIFYQVGAKNILGTTWSAENIVTPVEVTSATINVAIAHHVGMTESGGVFVDYSDPVTGDAILWAGPFDGWDVDRSFISFDTSALGVGATITSAKLYLDYQNSDYTEDDIDINVHESTWDLNSPDYNNIGNYLSSSRVSVGQAFGLTTFVVNPGYINRVGATKFAIKAADEDYYIYYNADPGYSRLGSYLEITYTKAVSQVPSAPTGVSSVAGNGQATIAWTAGTGATSSLIRYGTTTGTYTTLIDPATSPQTITGLLNGAAYYYQIGAKNAGGTTWSAEFSVIPVLPAPSAPTAISAIAGNTQMTISWLAGTGATSSLIKYGTTSGVYTSTLDPATSSQTISNLTNGTTVYYQVGAKNAGGTTWSAEYSVTPVASSVQTWSTPGTFTYVVPTGVISITATIKGGGGSGGNWDTEETHTIGKNGNLVSADIPVTPGSTLTIHVGGGGLHTSDINGGTGGFGYHSGGGGASGEGSGGAWTYGGAGGGGSSAITLNSVRFAEAAGGAGGNSSDYDDSVFWYEDGGYYYGASGGSGGGSGSDYPAVTIPGGGGSGGVRGIDINGPFGSDGVNGSVSISY